MPECRICNSSNAILINYNKHQIIKCDDCKVIFNAVFPQKSELDSYYSEEYNYSGSEIIETEFRRVSRIPEQIELISTINKIKKTPAKMLDIGCDKGFFLDEARRFGYDVAGIEPSKTGKKYSMNNGIQIFDSINEINSKVDIVTLFHVLEHFENPVKELNKIKNIISEDGIIIIRVPDFGSFYSRLLKSRWIWFQPENHLFHFTEISLKNILEISGFSIVELRKRKPNNMLTKRSYRLTGTMFSGLFDMSLTMRKRIARIYEDITGSELFAVARPG